MPVAFHHATAEQIVAVAEAVYFNKGATVALLESFCGFSTQHATNAANLAVEIGLLTKQGDTYDAKEPLSRFLTTPDDKQKSAVLRLLLESFQPFIIFRERLAATASAEIAATQTKVKLDLDAHREEIKDTLISLGTYTNALRSRGGGRYTIEQTSISTQLSEAVKACVNLATAESQIVTEIGVGAEQCSREDVIVPLASALLKAKEGLPVDAVTDAGKAIESYLAELAGRMKISLVGANGIIQKIDKFKPNLPKKLLEAAKYLGQVRNAADHGTDVDPDVSAVWKIQKATGHLYVFVACAFIAACTEREAGGDFII